MDYHFLNSSQAHLLVKRPQVLEGLRTYQFLMARRDTADLTADRAFQDSFTKFYRMKRFCTIEFLKRYFECMEQFKYQTDHSFVAAFNMIYGINATMQISFCSKMVHTFDDSQPIWDQIVATDHFGFKRPYPKCKSPIDRCTSRYEEYTDVFYRYLRSEEGQALIAAFDEQYPNSGISDVKKVDFILWQDR